MTVFRRNNKADFPCSTDNTKSYPTSLFTAHSDTHVLSLIRPSFWRTLFFPFLRLILSSFLFSILVFPALVSPHLPHPLLFLAQSPFLPSLFILLYSHFSTFVRFPRILDSFVLIQYYVLVLCSLLLFFTFISSKTTASPFHY